MSKHLDSVYILTCMKSLVLAFNFTFWLSGVTVFAVGIWMQCELYKYFELSTKFPGTAPYVLIGTGALIIIIGSLACCCTLKGQPALLYLYGAFLAVIFVLELGTGMTIYAYRSKLADGFNQGLNQSMVQYQNGSKEKIAAYDLIQTTLHCCGVRSPNDWGNLQPPVPVPLSCCKEENMNCDVGNEVAIYDQGCYDKVIHFLDSTIGLIASLAFAITFFPLVGLILSCCLAFSINRAKYEQMA